MRRFPLRIVVIGLSLILFFSRGSGAEPEFGTVCVAYRAAAPFRRQVISPVGKASSGGLQVKIDKRPTMLWPQRESLKIDGLDLKERHVLAIVDAHGKPVDLLWFRFSIYKSARLFLSYDGYQGIGLDDDTPCPRCMCKWVL